MSVRNKVLWTDGLFLRPQHFQQQERYIEFLVNSRCAGFGAHGWGFTELSLDRGLLGIGQVFIERAVGVLPDGTPFAIPEVDDAPEPLLLDADVMDQLVMLSVPIRRPDTAEVSNSANNSAARYTTATISAVDVVRGRERSASVPVGKLRTSLRLDDDSVAGHVAMPIARIVQAQPGSLVTDQAFIPPVTHCQASAPLYGYLKELLALVRAKGNTVSEEIQGSRTARSEYHDLLMLQIINRNEPILANYLGLRGLHPERLFDVMLGLAGELATLSTTDRRVGAMPRYQHDDLQASFAPVMATIRNYLSVVHAQRAVSLDLVGPDRAQIWRWSISDRALLDSSAFWLAVKADEGDESVKDHLLNKSKIAATERINQMIGHLADGIERSWNIRPPETVPFHRGFQYFELDKQSKYWQALEESSALALYVPGTLSGVEMELWAVRDSDD